MPVSRNLGRAILYDLLRLGHGLCVGIFRAISGMIVGYIFGAGGSLTVACGASRDIDRFRWQRCAQPAAEFSKPYFSQRLFPVGRRADQIEALGRCRWENVSFRALAISIL